MHKVVRSSIMGAVDNEEFDKLVKDAIKTPMPVEWIMPVKAEKVSVRLPDALKRTRQVKFLKALEKCGLISAACAAAGINQITELRWRKTPDPWYAQQFRDAMQVYRDSVEMEVHNRAINGVEVPIIGRVQRKIGEDVDGNPIFAPEDAVIATKTIKRDLLLMFHAKKHIPEYREKYEAPADTGDIRSAASPMARITVRLEMIAERQKLELGSGNTLGSGITVDIPASDVHQVTETKK